MDYPYCAVMTQSHVYLVIPKTWLKNKEKKMTEIFYSPNQNDQPNFNLPLLYFVDKTKQAVYNAYTIRFLSKFFVTHILFGAI